LTAHAVERMLADFRTWLTDVAATPPAPPTEPPAVDLHTLVAQFTALRHEVNLQTRAARTSLEQTGQALQQLEGAVEELRERPAEEDDEVGPLLKSLIDVYDNLALALRQVEKQWGVMDPALDEWVAGSDVPALTTTAAPEPRPGFFRRLFGGRAVRILRAPEVETALKEIEARHQRTAEAAKLVRSSFDGLIAGYWMSLARVGRAVEQAGLEVIAAEGEPFDPEFMEVVEAVGGKDRPAGEVVEEVRRGYLRGDVVFRYAQVKVAR